MSRGPAWTEDEQRILAANLGNRACDFISQLPGRSLIAVTQYQHRMRHAGEATVPVPPVKKPGEYVETVNAYLVDEFECMEIWLKWNGYASYRELRRDMQASALGVVTILATAK